MKSLVIDTATEACSVALEVDGKQYADYEVCPQQHSQKLLPMVDAILQQAGKTLTDLEVLAFGQGPGSFTGVRIATGMLQGLALGADLPVVGVSTLAAMAQQAHVEYGANEVVALIDARMGEVYFGHYRVDGKYMALVGSEQVISPEQAISLMAEVETPFVGVGTGWQAYPLLSEGTSVTVLDAVLLPNAKFMLPLAEFAFQQGEAMAIDDVQPVYLRDKVTWKKLPGRE